MSQHAKVLWGEGLFLRPQHFQHQDAYTESLIQAALLTAQPFGWGIRDAEVDHDAMKFGTLRFNRIDAVLPNGETFLAPAIDQLPLPLALDSLVGEEGGTVIHLALHRLNSHGGNSTDNDSHAGQARYLLCAADKADLFTDAANADITVLSKRSFLKAGHEPLEQFLTLPLLKVRRTSSGAFEHDRSFLPPSLTVGSSPLLTHMLRRQLEALQAKANALYGVHREPSKNVIEFRSGDIASFWLLHTVSSACAALLHLFRNPEIHPERMYQELLRLAGGLMTFSRGYGLNDLPAYDHAMPGEAFLKLDAILRDLLETVISTRYFAIALTAPKPAFHTGRLDSDKIGPDTVFYLGVSASHAQSEIIDTVPTRFKIGAPDDVEKLVLSAMSGVRLTHAQQVPTAIPVRPGACYFNLDTHGALYERMLKAQSITIYAPESYQDLKLELIAVTS